MTIPKFPTMLRKMWSGAEVQAWIDAHWPAPPQSGVKRASEELLRASYSFPRSHEGNSEIIDPEFVTKLREIILSSDDLSTFAPDPEQVESVLIALERLKQKS